MEKFSKRVYGCAVVKAINSNYNADFSGQPRRLPSGKVYATDKAFKYTIKNYLKDNSTETIFNFKRLNESMNPISLSETFQKLFPATNLKDKVGIRKKVGKDLLSCLDIRCFGATFASAGNEGTNVSIHGPVQINHGVNIWHEDNIFTEQITSPFSNKSDDKDADKGMTTIGRQSKLEEGHYAHHFSINPMNIEKLASECGADGLVDTDMVMLREAMRRGATYYDSCSKAGTENELLLWITLKQDSKIVLQNISTLIEMEEVKKEGKVVFDFAKLTTMLDVYNDQIDKIELFANTQCCVIENKPANMEIVAI